jgi:hypothetical protein
VVKRKIPSPRRESNPRTPIVQPVALLVYADYINLLGDSISTINENPEILLGASRDVGLEINAERQSV